MYWQMETAFSVRSHASYITPLSILLYIRSALGVQQVLHHPELYIESNYEYILAELCGDNISGKIRGMGR